MDLSQTFDQAFDQFEVDFAQLRALLEYEGDCGRETDYPVGWLVEDNMTPEECDCLFAVLPDVNLNAYWTDVRVDYVKALMARSVPTRGRGFAKSR